MAILCFEWITTVIKYKLITRNRLWNTGAATQESLKKIGWDKSLYLLELKKNKTIVRFFGVCAVVLSATDLMKCSSDYVVHREYFMESRCWRTVFTHELLKYQKSNE